MAARMLCLVAGYVLISGSSVKAQDPPKTLVVKEATQIYAGREVVGKLSAGQRVEVRQVKDNWVGIVLPQSGWVTLDKLIEASAALQYFNERLQSNPQDESALLARSRLWMDRSEQQRALAVREWNETIKADPKLGAAYYQRAQLWRKVNEFDRTIADLDLAIQYDPFFVDAYQDLADVLLERGDQRRAITLYTELIRLRPWQAQPFADRGWAHHLAGNNKAALEDLEIARRLNPQNAQICYRLGLMHAVDEYSYRATECFDMAIQLNPQMAEAYFARAPRHKGFKAEEKTIKDYNTAIHLNPQFLAAYHERGMFYLEQGQFDNAIRDLTHVIQLNPRRETAFLERGKMYLERDQGELALQDLKQAAELNPELSKQESEVFVKAYRSRAQKRLADKKYELAAEDLTAAIAITPEDLDLVSERGQCYLLAKKFSPAIADFSTVAEGRSEEPEGWFALAHAWYLAGEYSRAAVEYRKAILVEPTFVPAYTNLAWMLATCPQKEIRNGKMALRYAKYACELTGWRQYAILDTLAAAEAESGDFHEAIKWQSAVVYLAPPGEREQFRERLELYGSLKPFHEEAPETAGITSETDTAGVLAKNDDEVVDFAKSLSLPLPDLTKLTPVKQAQEPTAEPQQTAEPQETEEPKKFAEPKEIEQTLPAPTANVTAEKTPAPEENLDLELNLPESDTTPANSSETSSTPAAKPKEEPLPPDDQKSVAALEKLGGRISKHLTGQVQSLGLQYTKFTDQEAELLSGLGSLEILDLTFTKVGDATLKKLGEMKQLKLIVLDQTKVTNEMLAHLSELPNLEVISVKATSISGPGLMHLKNLPKLSMVLMNGTRVTGTELKELQAAMPKVKFRR